jgi:DNA topoisomerase-1
MKASRLNEYLKELMDGLSAKVFRTYNASITLQQQLDKKDVPETVEELYKESVESKAKFYNDANRAVAVLCNHQKAQSKGHEAQMEKLQDNVRHDLNNN